ncbi:hypothetical protein [Paenibacillus alvei]|uniref:hypothetical protein n=1 Tax=Paenibacillus alvei TaxID=44250 RepID=UPI0013DAC5B6|nr:hypothetical protein [Paenibacillus alvei]MBG9735778.1 hypothetical protein [Paenibacillus alvei]MBG9744363.1 hypothetical protein [Paenibacillus alvei]MCY9577899.1 hypothetical protein [Paenibacillus alvei]MCY9587334.1 hypothetical protein [Paenibacillus alvei]NEZ45469.1 hypothetical protein [Paenibacillus alvei]
MAEGTWNRWSVYEYMKQRFERTYEVPSLLELKKEFASIGSDEIEEGIQEFESRVCGAHVS